MLFKKRQQLAICVMAGAVVSVFMLFWYLPLHKKMKVVKQAKAAQSLAIAKGTSDSKQLPIIKEQLQQFQARLENFEANIPEHNAFGEFMGKITDLMKENNLQEQQITPGQEIHSGQFNCIPVTMHCKGKLTQIFKLYRQLQTLDRLIRIEQVKLFNDTDYDGLISMETRAVIFYRAKVG